MNKCKVCGNENQQDFYASNKAKCKECTKISVRNNYRLNIDSFKAYERKRASLPHRVKARNDYAKSIAGIERGNQAKNRWALSHPIQSGASTMIGNAVRDKKIFKPNICSECKKESKRLEGHHDDYAYPLIVRWLCRKCHYDWHKTNAPLNGD